MAMNGTDIMIWVEGNAVGSQRDVTIDEKTAEIDVSNKNDGRAMRVLPGRYDAVLNLDALYVPTDQAYQDLQSAMRNGTFVEVVVIEEGVVLESADAIVTSLSRKGPDQGEATVAAGLRVDGSWVSGS
jgi:predicted secreted protein